METVEVIKVNKKYLLLVVYLQGNSGLDKCPMQAMCSNLGLQYNNAEVVGHLREVMLSL